MSKNNLTEAQKDAAKARADDFWQKYGRRVNNSSAIDPAAIANRQGFEVAKTILKDKLQAAIFVNLTKKDVKALKINSNRLIIVDHKLDEGLQRFAIAHELGHFALHYKEDGEYFSHTCTDVAFKFDIREQGPEEQEADYFAACLLMPESEFITKYNDYKKNKDRENKLAKYFNVPSKSVERRIGELILKND